MNNLLKEKQFIFIIGSERSGTTWLQAMLGGHPNIATTWDKTGPLELEFFDIYLSLLVETWDVKNRFNKKGWPRGKGISCLWSKDEFNSFINDFIEKVYSKVIINNSKATHILDKRPGYSLYTDLIHRFIPSAKFIHIIRDGRVVVVSLLSTQKRLGWGFTSIERAARGWKKHVLGSRKAMKFGKKNYLEIRYESLLKNTKEELKKVFRFCSLDYTDDLLNNIVNKYHFEKKMVSTPNPDIPLESRRNPEEIWKKGLSLEQKYIFNKKAGDLLVELNYEKDNSWWFDSYLQKIIFRITRIIKKVIIRIKITLKCLLRGRI